MPLNSVDLGLVDLSLAVILGLVGLSLTVGLFYVLLSPVLGRLRVNRDLIRFKRALEQIESADQLIEEKRFQDAVNTLRSAVLYDLFRTRDMILSFREHYQNILSRCLVISEDSGGRAPNLGTVERLFGERAELLSLLQKARDAFERLIERRGNVGKPTPSWTKDDYQKRISEITEELKVNRIQLERELEQLFEAIKSPISSNVTIH